MLVHSHLLSAEQRSILRLIDVEQFCDPECVMDFGRADIFKELAEIKILFAEYEADRVVGNNYIRKKEYCEHLFQQLINLVNETATDVKISVYLIFFGMHIIKHPIIPTTNTESFLRAIVSLESFRAAEKESEVLKQFLPKNHSSAGLS